MKTMRFWFILIRKVKHWYNTQINRVIYQKTTDSRYCSPYTPPVTYNILCSYSLYSREHMSSSYTFSCKFSRRLEESATLDVIQPLDAGGKYVFPDWSAVLFLARWNWLQSRACTKNLLVIASVTSRLFSLPVVTVAHSFSYLSISR